MATKKTRKTQQPQSGRSIKEYRASDLIIDPQVQKENPPTAARVKQLTRNFDLDKMGIITVSRRANDDVVVLDGQTRVAALIELRLGDWLVRCEEYTNLTIEEEANLFRLLNNTRRPSPYDDFRVGITADDPEGLSIMVIVTKHGLKLASCSGDGNVACISALRDCYRSGGLDWALETATLAWGLKADAVSASMVRALSIIWETYGNEVDQPALIAKLAKHMGGAAGLLGNARATRMIRSASIARLCAAAIITVYNRKRRNGALADL